MAYQNKRKQTQLPSFKKQFFQVDTKNATNVFVNKAKAERYASCFTPKGRMFEVDKEEYRKMFFVPFASVYSADSMRRLDLQKDWFTDSDEAIRFARSKPGVLFVEGNGTDDFNYVKVGLSMTNVTLSRGTGRWLVLSEKASEK